jgi:hypothetical protein
MLSDLQRDSAGSTSLDARVRQVRRASSNGVLRIVSFSGFGEELREAWEGDEKTTGGCSKQIITRDRCLTF